MHLESRKGPTPAAGNRHCNLDTSNSDAPDEHVLMATAEAVGQVASLMAMLGSCGSLPW